MSANTVAALMAGQSLAARRKKRRRSTTRPGKGRWRAPDLVKRVFPAARINCKWHGDGTEIETGEGKLHLAGTGDAPTWRVSSAPASPSETRPGTAPHQCRQPSLWRHRLQAQTAKAAIAEATGDPAAATLYAEVAAGWEEYGHVLEHDLCLLGLGRCRYRAGHPDTITPLRAARVIFTRLGATAPLAETDSLRGGQLRHTS